MARKRKAKNAAPGQAALRTRKPARSRWRPGLFMSSEVSTSLGFKETGQTPVHAASGDLITRLEAQCFICKEQLTHSSAPNQGTITREDVFPQWLWEKFELQDCFIDFPHGDSKKYPEILVPCCNSCNNRWMSQVEQRISRAGKAADEYPEFIKLSRSDLSLWTAKIFYGLLMLSIKPWDFEARQGRPARFSGAILDHLQLATKLLDGFRKRVIINAPAHPFSILMFRLKSGGPAWFNFDYRDNLEWPTALALRMGSLGLLVVFEDFGYVEDWYRTRLASLLDGKILHPVQFLEVVARAFYHAGLGGYDYSYSLIDGANDTYISLKPYPTEGRPRSDDRLSELMVRLTGDQGLGEVIDGKSPSLLVRHDGSFRDLPFIAPTVDGVILNR